MHLTESVNRKLKLFKNMACVLRGWKVQDCESSVFTNGERALAYIPSELYLYFSHVTWTVDPALGVGVFPLVPVARTWAVHKGHKSMCERKGFTVIPNFAGTAHMVHGADSERRHRGLPGYRHHLSTS